MISGSWPGEIFVFRGKKDGGFHPPEKLKDKDGNVINIGGGVREGKDEIMITGDAEVKEDKDGHYVVYNGKTYRNTPEKQVFLTGCASAVAVADWNGDGLPDLIVGEIGGKVSVYWNEGAKGKSAFGKPVALKVDGKDLMVPHGDSGPCLADWDGDGKLDLIVGCGDGSVQFYRNVGTVKEPKLAKAEELVPKATVEYEVEKMSKSPSRGIRAKVCVADWNGDGLPDLLVGDYSTQLPDRPELTADERKKQAEAKAELKKLNTEFGALIGKTTGSNRAKSKEEAKEVAEQMKKLSGRMIELQKIAGSDYESHGYVWLYLREGPRPSSSR